MENNVEEKELSEPIEIESISNVVYDLDMGSFDDRLIEAYIQNPQMLRRVQKGSEDQLVCRFVCTLLLYLSQAV